MSNIAIFKNGSGVPAHFRSGELDELTKSLMGSGGGLTNRRISIRGSVFRMMVNGEEVNKNEDRSMNVIIVAAAPKTGRSYYGGTYTEGVNTAPDCWSNDGEKPDPKSESPQSTACATCPMNIAGSGQGNSRACRYSRRLGVLLEGDDQAEVYQLILPAQSIFGQGEKGKMPLEQYARFLAGHGISVTSVVTEMRFDTSSATPKLTFSAVRPLSEDELELAIEKGKSPEAVSAITFNPTPSEKKEESPFKEPPKAAAPKDKELKVEAPAPVAEPEVVEEPEVVVEPKVRTTKQPAAPAPANDIDSLLAEWGDDDDEE